MESDENSLSKIVTDISCNSMSLDDKLKCEETEGYESEHDNSKTDRDLDLNFQSIQDDNNNFKEDDSSEKLSAVMEQPEDTLQLSEDTESSEDEETKKLNHSLQERMKVLAKLIVALRDELKTEMALWKKEREEFQLMRDKCDILALEEATAAARAAAVAYAAERPLSNDIDDLLDITSEQTLQELTILEYEKKLAKYQDALSLAQAEKRYNMRRQLVAKAYERKLAEVERLCNEELEIIRQNASNLQPLKEIASQWYIDEKNRGDAPREFISGSDIGKKQTVGDAMKENSNFRTRAVDAEVNMIPEIFVAKFKNEDILRHDKIWKNS